MSAAGSRGGSRRSRRQRIAAGAVLATTGLISTYMAAIRPQPTYATPNSKDPVQAGGTGLPGALLQPRNGSTPSCQGLTPVTTEALLAAAITAANGTPTTESICIDGSITLQSSLPTITSSVTLVGTDRSTDKLVGGAAGVGSILTVDMSSASQTLEIANLSFEYGVADTPVSITNVDTYQGGAVALSGTAATLTVTNSAFASNYAPAISNRSGRGGAIGWQGSVSITDSTFQDNKTGDFAGPQVGGSQSKGGALWVSNGDVTIDNSTFERNKTDQEGGAIAAVGGSVTITNSDFTANEGAFRNAESGGAVFVTGLAGDLAVYGSTFTDNVAGFGGGHLRGE